MYINKCLYIYMYCICIYIYIYLHVFIYLYIGMEFTREYESWKIAAVDSIVSPLEKDAAAKVCIYVYMTYMNILYIVYIYKCIWKYMHTFVSICTYLYIYIYINCFAS
jgi:hypothetical protein